MHLKVDISISIDLDKALEGWIVKKRFLTPLKKVFLLFSKK